MSTRLLRNFYKNIKDYGVGYDKFFTFHPRRLEQAYDRWVSLLPNVTPFYAVKCNPYIELLRHLANLGTSFDCASDKEIDVVRQLGVEPSRIIHAHPCKPHHHITAARLQGVDLTTFDSIPELYKISALHPTSRCLLRIRADDETARCVLGSKFGAENQEISKLLGTATQLGLAVTGVAFHVGSDSRNTEAYKTGIGIAKKTFIQAQAMGHDMTTLNLGGGFTHDNILSTSSTLNSYLSDSFWRNVTLIAEPGRYLAQSAMTLYCRVHGKRVRNKQGQTHLHYWISDGVYGNFNNIIYDHATVRPVPVQNRLPDSSELFMTTIFGPTCDSLDAICREIPMKEMLIGDWVVFQDMGAYTIPGASDFNGFNATQTLVVRQESE